jgi:septal ring factor EnvC (AmiA/AmiB activator)
VGDTGSLSGPSLYFEIREDGKPVDPAAWLMSSSKSNSRAVTDRS